MRALHLILITIFIFSRQQLAMTPINDAASALNQAAEREASVFGLTKREYFAVHLFEGVTVGLSVNCTLRDKAKHAVDAADALMEALELSPGERS
jgi:hypothetical protein